MRRPSVRNQPRFAKDPIAWLTLCREPPAISANWLWFNSMVTIGAGVSPARRTRVLATRPGRSRKTWSAFCSVSRRMRLPSERITASSSRGLACTSSMKAGRDRASAVESSIASADADRAEPSKRDTSPITSGGRTTVSTARSPVGAVRKTATAPRRSTISDSPGSPSTKSSCPLRYVRGTAAASTRWRASGSKPANISTPVSASPGSRLSTLKSLPKVLADAPLPRAGEMPGHSSQIIAGLSRCVHPSTGATSIRRRRHSSTTG
jgi:hypothetical protein